MANHTQSSAPSISSEEGDAHLAQEVPGPVAVAGVGLPEVARAEMARTSPRRGSSSPGGTPARSSSVKQVVDEGVGPGEATRRRACPPRRCSGSRWRPSGPTGRSPGGSAWPVGRIPRLPPNKSREAQRGGTVQGADGVLAVAPPDLAPLLAARGRARADTWAARPWAAVRPAAARTGPPGLRYCGRSGPWASSRGAAADPPAG